MVRVVMSSIGSAATIYILVAITGYVTFGNDIVGNIVLMCKFSHHLLSLAGAVHLTTMQIPPALHPPLARLLSSYWFCFPFRFRSILVAHH